MELTLLGVHIPTACALAVVVAIAYVLGRIGRRPDCLSDQRQLELERELARAHMVVANLEKVVNSTGSSLHDHALRLQQFKSRLLRIAKSQDPQGWQHLGREIESILEPTVHLAAEVAGAHDVIRYQSSLLMTFAETHTDPLTGVRNRRGLDQVLGLQMQVLDRYGSRFSMLLLDIDHFKEINDRQGHLTGDRALKALATALQQEARAVDSVARYGGDEFAVVMPQTGLQGAITMANRIRARIHQELSFTVSIGVAAAEKGDALEALFLRVDSALYAAKNEGRNRVCWHDGSQAEVVAPAPSVPLPIVDAEPFVPLITECGRRG